MSLIVEPCPQSVIPYFFGVLPPGYSIISISVDEVNLKILKKP
jgi:hypothetical protein